MKHELMGWQWHQTDKHTSISSLNFFMNQMLFLPPNQQRQGNEGEYCDIN